MISCSIHSPVYRTLPLSVSRKRNRLQHCRNSPLHALGWPLLNSQAQPRWACRNGRIGASGLPVASCARARETTTERANNLRSAGADPRRILCCSRLQPIAKVRGRPARCRLAAGHDVSDCSLRSATIRSGVEFAIRSLICLGVSLGALHAPFRRTALVLERRAS